LRLSVPFTNTFTLYIPTLFKRGVRNKVVITRLS